ncbi:hypothetical protein [Thioalkalivibrio thiocyanodenitrificans]|uniref:hypothetical protein n=1 Tax=Thioalkalivibrio thiocyanodenitrificans TaxID=243063 RepID=UPI00036FFE25|nr:hypothetical protein [Thioalkalivibrio thiocyanodenitrificans]
MRHLGELAEICLVRHIESLGLEVEHLDEDTAAGKPDLLIEGYPVGVKAVKRKGPILSHYSMQITKAHAHEPVDSFFFCSYEYPLNRLWLVGGISRLRFMREAVFVGEGEAVHSAYRIRPGHSIYNINVMQLIPPRAFLCGFGRARCA